MSTEEVKTMFPRRLRRLVQDHGGIVKVCEDTQLARTGMSEYLSGKRLPKIDTLSILCHYFDVSADYILGLAPENNRTPDELVRAITDYTGLSNQAVELFHSTHIGQGDTPEAIAENRLAVQYINRACNHFEIRRVLSLAEHAMNIPTDVATEVQDAIQTIGEQTGGYYPGYSDLYLTFVLDEIRGILKRNANESYADKMWPKEVPDNGKH